MDQDVRYPDYVCEECGCEMTDEEASTETYPGCEGPVTLAFCRDCRK